jgi:hypothetical protein
MADNTEQEETAPTTAVTARDVTDGGGGDGSTRRDREPDNSERSRCAHPGPAAHMQCPKMMREVKGEGGREKQANNVRFPKFDHPNIGDGAAVRRHCLTWSTSREPSEHALVPVSEHE